MNREEVKAKLLAAVNLALPSFKSALPVGELGNDIVIPYMQERRSEIISAARQALPAEYASLSDEEVLDILYR